MGRYPESCIQGRDRYPMHPITDPAHSDKVFVPVTDELLYEHPERITAPLRPYQVSEPCYHWLAIEVEVTPVADREPLP